MRRSETCQRPAAASATDIRRFIDGWLRENLPPFYRDFSVVELAERLRRDARRAGVDLGQVEADTPFAIEHLIVRTAEARVPH
jgi:hypothetical protein